MSGYPKWMGSNPRTVSGHQAPRAVAAISHETQAKTSPPAAPPPAPALAGLVSARGSSGAGPAHWALGWLMAAGARALPSGDVPKHPGHDGSPKQQVTGRTGSPTPSSFEGPPGLFLGHSGDSWRPRGALAGAALGPGYVTRSPASPSPSHSRSHRTA